MLVPYIRFDGSESAKQMSRIFAENLQDLLLKIDDGKNDFDRGFFHTSTVQHEGTCYYNEIWSRDAGRGLIELARLGFKDEARQVAAYLLENINEKDHWGRAIPNNYSADNETDGNALILLGISRTWKANNFEIDLAKTYLAATLPVFKWMEKLMDSNEFSLLPSNSELSGNPNTPYSVFGIYPNYAALEAIYAFRAMACKADLEEEQYYDMLGKRLEKAIRENLISRGQSILTPKNIWLNGIDSRDGRPYEFSEWDGTSWPIYHWTRQLPYILSSDMREIKLLQDNMYNTNLSSYEYILNYMSNSRYFRKYGFVSNTGWTGTGERHDDTMCGYGQGFMTQAALLADDVNTYSKLLEGVARLAYDGDVVQPLSFEMNPWVMHECFNYENYEEGYDHTFGVKSEGRPQILENPGDEGNLVQAAEILKVFAIIAGVDDSNQDKLIIRPRIPWIWDDIYVENYPAVIDGESTRIEYKMTHERWKRTCTIKLKSTARIKNADFRIGPFPAYLKLPSTFEYYVENSKGASWIWIRDIEGYEYEKTISLYK